MKRFTSPTITQLILCSAAFGALNTCGAAPVAGLAAGGGVTKTEMTGNPVGEELELKTAAWQQSLSNIARLERAPVFFVINLHLNWFPPNMDISVPRGPETMKALSLATGHHWEQTRGVQVFTDFRSYPHDDANVSSKLVSWILSLEPADRKRLVEGDFALFALPPNVREAVLSKIGGDPDAVFTALDKGNQFMLRLSFDPVLVAAGAQNTPLRLMMLPDPKPAAEATQQPLAEPGDALQKSDGGPLDFGPGTVLPLEEILKKATAAFGKNYTVDSLKPESRVFISGQYSEESFQSSIERATAPERTDAAPAPQKTGGAGADEKSLLDILFQNEFQDMTDEAIDITWMRSAIRGPGAASLDELEEKYGPADVIPVDDILKRKSFAASELSLGKPGLAQIFKQRGIGGQTIVTLRPGLALSVGTSGLHRVGSGTSIANGKVLTVASRNQFRIGLF